METPSKSLHMLLRSTSRESPSPKGLPKESTSMTALVPNPLHYFGYDIW